MPTRQCLAGLLLTGCIMACSRRHNPILPVPVPNPEPTAPVPPAVISPSPASWTFHYAPGTFAYSITRSATIQNTDSVTNSTRVSASATQDSLTLEASEHGEIIKAIRIPPPADQTPNAIPIEISASLADNILIIDSSTTDSCTSIKSILTTDLYNLVVPFPAQLLPGLAWKDSVDLPGCQTGVPTLAQVSRSFLVTGDSIYQGKHFVIITRADTLKAQGKGGLQQHRLTLYATGTGMAVYYLNPESGRVVRLTVNQDISFEVSTVETKSHFRQLLTQEFVLRP